MFLLNYKQIVHLLFKQLKKNGFVLEFVLPEYKKDEEIVLLAIGNDRRAIQFADEELKKNNNFITEVL